VPNGEWTWLRELLGTNSALPTSEVFRLDDGIWRRVVGYQRIGTEVVHLDYATGDGKTVRFGDGQFGAIPASGTIFQVSYRLGNGSRDNVTAGTLTQCLLPLVTAVTNPLAAVDGADPETPQQIRQLAPEAFRAVTFRAVRPEDYADALARLDWVQRAGAAFRWTGSWLTAYATPDPKGSTTVTADERTAAFDQLDRFRQAGRPAFMLDPVYANLDLRIAICVDTSAFKGEVEESVLEVLFGVSGIRPRPGFFSPDNFTFGTPLERSELEAAIQNAGGVRAVEEIHIRRRGWFGWRIFSELTYAVAPNEVIRLQNDPLLPERGSVRLVMRGGA
jgi:predicted phage baseplate assembly protein